MIDDKTPNATPPQADPETGRYDVSGTRYPKVAVGVNNVIIIDNGNGDPKVILGKRSEKLAHAGKWSLLGGFVEIASGHGVTETITKEIEEETDAQFPISINNPSILFAFLDYADVHNDTCLALTNRVILRGTNAQKVNDFVAQQSGVNEEVTEHMLISLNNFEKEFSDKEMAYPHELKGILIARDELNRGKEMESAVEHWVKEPTLKHQWEPNFLEMVFVNKKDPDITKTPQEINEMILAKGGQQIN